MKIAVVILNWDGVDLLKKFLPIVVSFSKEATIYVIDNASQDNSIAYIRSTFPEVTIIQNTENVGYAKGYNVGLQQIKADVYCLLNSDVEVTKNWLTPIIPIFSENKNIVAIQPKILNFNNKEQFEYAGAAGGFIDKYGFPFCRGRVFDSLETDNGQYNNQQTIFWASGACFFVRSDTFHQLGGFDEDFFAHQEEIDLCWRIFNTDKKIIYTPKSVVYHVGGGTLSASNPRKTYLNFRNGLYMLLKNLPKNQLFSTIFIRLILDGIAGIRFFLQGKFHFTFSVIKAHFDFYAKILHFYKKRGGTQKEDYFTTKSVVFSYFFKKKRYFDRI